MSFRDNLQRLRARDGLTQEQFALMLGVSRQAVSKWEAERAYPEMDKLLRMCDLFGCTLDELVRGDVVATGSSESERQLENEGEAATCVQESSSFAAYDAHMRRRARLVAAAVGLGFLGLAAMVRLGGSSGLAFLWGGLLPVSSRIVLVVTLAAVTALIMPAVREHMAFRQRYRRIEGEYTERERTAAHDRLFKIGLVCAALFCAGIAAFVLFAWSFDTTTGLVCLLMGVAAAASSAVYASFMAARMDVAGYNARNELVSCEPGAVRLRIFSLVMTLATAVALVGLFLLDWPFFWLSWVFGALACLVCRTIGR